MNSETRSSWRAQLRSPLGWHIAGVGLLTLVVLGIGIRLGYVWTFSDASAERTLQSRTAQLEALSADTLPLRGLDKRVDATRTRIDGFYTDRIPASYSLVATRISELELHSGVRLSRIQYTQGAPGIDLTEISMDAAVTGDYAQIMHFVNGLERDQLFFVIRAMTLNSQQSGTVNLRLRVSTWLRTADAAASGLPMTKTATETGHPPVAAGREGF